MSTWYRVQVNYGDGRIYLSRAFRSEAEATTWAGYWKKVRDAVEVRVLVRPVPKSAA
jgi:hypothetical protein